MLKRKTNDTYYFIPYEKDYYDVCTYSGDQQRYDLILEVIKKGMRLNNNYEPGIFLLGMCIENDIHPKSSLEVIELIKGNIDKIKAVYCRCVMDDICGYNEYHIGISPAGKMRNQILDQPTKDKARKQLNAIRQMGAITDENYLLISDQIDRKWAW